MNERQKFKFSIRSEEAKISDLGLKLKRGMITLSEFNEKTHDIIDNIVKITGDKFFNLGMNQLNIFSRSEHEKIK